MLLTLIVVPLVGALTVASINKETKGYDLLIRKLSLSFSILVWILSSFLWVSFMSNTVHQLANSLSKSGYVVSLDNSTVEMVSNLSTGVSFAEANVWTQYQFVTTILSLNRIGELQVGIDGLGLIFVVLTAYLIPVAILSTWNTVTHNSRSQLVLLLLLESILFLVFTSLDLITFYVSFETVLIPLFIIIGLHGSTNARIRASMLLFMYTLIGSFFMLLGIMQLFVVTGTSDMILLTMKAGTIAPESQRWIWLGIFFSIAIKSPLFPLHGWLFRAHSEASLAGSIILAGIVLKLATYAYLRILIPMLPDACEYFRPLVLTIGSISLLHGSLATLRQVDSKCFIAYSSVAHMSVVILGLASGTINGIQGAMLLSVAHGLISPALFIVVGGVLYDRYHTRIIRYYRGLGSFMPSLKVWFFLATVASMAVPGSLNWLGELLCITGTFETAPIAGLFGSTTVLLGAIYSIWIFNQLIGGHVSPYLALTNDLTYREWTLMTYLVIPAFILGVVPSVLTNVMTVPIFILASPLLYLIVIVFIKYINIRATTKYIYITLRNNIANIFMALSVILAHLTVEWYVTSYFLLLDIDSFIFYSIMVFISCIFVLLNCPYNTSFTELLIESNSWPEYIIVEGTTMHDPKTLTYTQVFILICTRIYIFTVCCVVGGAMIMAMLETQVMLEDELADSIQLYSVDSIPETALLAETAPLTIGNFNTTTYIPYFDYKGIDLSAKLLCKIYNTYKDLSISGTVSNYNGNISQSDIELASKLVEYLDLKTPHVLVPQTHTSVPFDYFSNLDNHPYTTLGKSNSNLPSHAATYVITDASASNIYIGAATDIKARFATHFGLVKSSKHVLYSTARDNGGFSGWRLYTPLVTDNLYFDFVSWLESEKGSVQMDIHQMGTIRYVLNIFTQFKIRVYEISLFKHLNSFNQDQPSLNGGAGNIGLAQSWKYGDGLPSNGRTTYAQDAPGNIYGPYASQEDASQIFGIDRRNISSSMNRTDYLTSTKGDTTGVSLRFSDGLNTELLPSTWSARQEKPCPLIDFSLLSRGPYFGVDETYTIRYIGDSINECRDQCNVECSKTRFRQKLNNSFINVDYTLIIAGVLTSFSKLMFVRSTDVTTFGYTITDPKDGAVYHLDSKKEVAAKLSTLSNSQVSGSERSLLKILAKNSANKLVSNNKFKGFTITKSSAAASSNFMHSSIRKSPLS